MNNLIQTVSENVGTVLAFAGTIVFLFVIAFLFEKSAMKKNNITGKIFTTRKVAVIGMFSALSAILMLFEFPLPFAPGFYKLDFSEIPALIGAFAFGPLTGVMIEFIKILLKLLFKGTSSAFVGELANFAVGCSYILPASVIYSFKKTKKSAVVSCIAGTCVITIFGSVFNAVYLIPAFSALYGMPMEAILSMGSAVNPLAKDGDMISFVIACVAPLNLVKGFLASGVTLAVYKHLSPVLKHGNAQAAAKSPTR